MLVDRSRLASPFRSLYLLPAALLFWPANASAQQAPGSPHEDPDINQRRYEWFYGQRSYPFTTFRQSLRLKAIETMERMIPRNRAYAPRIAPRVAVPNSNVVLSSSQWTSIGPQPLTWGTANSGRVWTVAVNPTNSSIVYIGTDGGGVWKTADGGTTWSPLTDTQPSLTITSIALAPSDPNTIFAATGNSSQANGTAATDAYGAGILKSIDGGATWSQIGAPFVQSNFVRSVSSVDVQPGNSQVVLAAAGNLYRSTDGGASWNIVLSTVNAIQVLFDPSNASHAFLMSNSGVYQSSDGGITWSPTNGAGNNLLPYQQFNFWSLAVSASSPNILYAAGRQTSDSSSGFYKSTDSGANWSAVGIPGGDIINYWGWTLRVHPTNPSVVFAGSLGMHVSTNGGTTWTDANGGGVHVDHHALTFTPDGSRLFLGNDGGIWTTTNTTGVSVTWTSLNTDITTALFYPGFSIHPTDVNTTFAGAQDNGTLRYGGSVNWHNVACGDGGWTAIDFFQPQNVYAACQNIEVLKSTAGGAPGFQSAQSGINTLDRSTFMPPLVMDPSSSQRLYFGTYRLYQTSDGAASWTAISGDLTNGRTIDAIAVAPSDSNTLYTGSSDGQIYVSRNALSGASATWTNSSSGLANRAVTQIAVHPQDPLTAYAALSGYSTSHVFKTTNGGATWAAIGSNLPDVPANDILIDPDQNTTLYLATDIGVFQSLDSGVSWLPLGAGMPRVVVSAVRLHRPTRTLRAVTYGRGAWDLWVPLTGQVLTSIVSNPAGAPFQLEDGTTYQAPVTFSWSAGAQHTITWLSSPPGQTGSRYVFQSWADGGSNPRTITVSASPTTYTANVQAQYQLTVNLSPSLGGSVNISPSSADGFYDSGASVTLTGVANSGYFFWYFSGDVPGSSSPQTVVMAAPRNVTANFYCSYFVYYPMPSTLGPASSSGLISVQTGAGCPWSIGATFPGSPWFTLGSPTSGTGNGFVSYTVSPNTGAARSATVTLTGTGYTNPMNVTQGAQGSSAPSVVSVTPNSGSGATQSFAFLLNDANGFGNIPYAFLTFTGIPSTNKQCTVVYSASNLYLVADDFSWQGPLTPTNVFQNSQCFLDGPHSSVSGSGNSLTINLALTFKTAFTGNQGITVFAADLTAGVYTYSSTQLVGAWTVPATSQSAITIQSNVPGAPFSLEDNSVYASPATFIWTQGAQHTVTWLGSSAAFAGSRYSFQSWADGGANPRTIVVPASDTSYSATLKVQYQLSVSSAPAVAGNYTANPSSTDGYYDQGTSVQITPVAAPGYAFWYYSGASGSTVTMNSPLAVTLNFYCSLQSSSYPASTVGPGPASAIFQWQTGAGCAWAISSNAAWITLTGPASGVGSGAVSYTIAENTGSSRSAAIQLSGDNFISSNTQVTQQASTSALPSVVSFSPASGTGLNQIFTLQAFEESGYQAITQATLIFDTFPSTGSCNVLYQQTGAQAFLYLLLDDGSTYSSPLAVPGTSNVSNSRCQLNGSQFSASGAGKTATLNFGVTFFQAFAGAKLVYAYVGNSNAGVSSSSQQVGAWTVSATPILSVTKTHTGDFTQGQNGATYTVTVSNANGAGSTSGPVTVTETVPSGMTLVSMAGTGWTCPANGTTCTRGDVLSPNSSYPAITVTVNVASGTSAQLTNQVGVSGGGGGTATANDPTNITTGLTALRFIPITPCRVADTRKPTGAFGGPQISGGTSRDFIVPNSACNIPNTAQAYSLNVAVVPAGPLGFLTLWPSGLTQPVVATLNSVDGRIKSNAAIVPAGANGAISVFASNTTNVILDINGYFVPATNNTALAFYPVTPCRIVDTRKPNAPLSGPAMVGQQSRTFPILSSSCGIPNTAQAYSLNFAAVPPGPLGFLTAYPTGQPRPQVASLNDAAGTTTANAVIVQAGTGGNIDVFASNNTNVVIDINGYFAPMSTGGLSLYNVTPCRVFDSRKPPGSPPLTGQRDVAVSGGSCGIPAAQAYVMSATVVPPAALGFLTLWAQGLSKPVVATLNAVDGVITSNMAIVPAANGSISAFPSNTTHLVLDVFGYFSQ